MMEKIYTPSQFANMINVTVKTLQRWDRKNILIAHRTITNRRYYTHTQYCEYMGIEIKNNKKKSVAYCRVSNRNQSDDLLNQAQFISSYIKENGLILDEIITDIGSGLNFKRKNWNKLLDDCIDGKIDKIYVSYRDRFVRFGFDWFDNFLRSHCKTELVVINNVTTSPEEELIADLISIIHVFSCRIYGLRKYAAKIKKAIK